MTNSSAYRSIFALLFSFGILLLANGLFNTLIAIKAKQENFSFLGLILSGFFLGLLLSSRYAVKVIAKVGYIRAFASFASIASTVALIHLLWVNPVLWGVLRVITGFCIGAMIIITEGWINEKATNENRGLLISIYMIINYACLGAAQLFIMFDTENGFKLFVIISILYSLALLPILSSQTTAPTIKKVESAKFLDLLKISPVGVVGIFVIGICNGIFYSLSPIYAISLGLDTKASAIFLALSISSGILLQLPLGKLSDKIDRRWVILISTVFTCIASLFLFLFNSESQILLYALAIFYGSTVFSINPICVAHINDLAPADQRAQTASNIMLFYGTGAFLGPIIAGFILPLGERYIFMLNALFVLGLAIYTLTRLVIKPRHLENKSKFHPLSSNSPARQLDFEKTLDENKPLENEVLATKAPEKNESSQKSKPLVKTE